jgi:cytochrome c553
MKRRLLRFGTLLLVLAFGGLLISASGIVPIKASAGHWAITRWFLRFSMQRSIATHSMGIDVPKLDDPALVLKGAGHYEIGCRSCHGAPGTSQPRIAQAMLPQPPELVPRIRESNPKKLFYVVKHGLKLTGMPAWPSQERDDEVWAMVAFLLKLPELDETGYRKLVHGTPAPIPPMQTMPPALFTEGLGVNVIETCARCHGHDGLGRGRGAFPKLAGQRREYFVNALNAYASGARHSGIMEPVAAALTDELIQNLAAHYAELGATARSTSSANTDPAEIERGREIAQHGIPDRRVPSCIECHGPKGSRTKAAYPSLAGQSADYLVLQLELFKENRRGGSAYAHLMERVAPKLKPEEVRAVARYFESISLQTAK